MLKTFQSLVERSKKIKLLRSRREKLGENEEKIRVEVERNIW